MKRFLTVALIAVVSLVGLRGEASAQPSQPNISSFDIEYHLDRDDEGRSTLDVTEKITAAFPENQNKGLVREIPKEYDGHTVSFSLETVTRNGEDEPIYNQYTKGDYHVIETGTDEYINGTQVFEIKYTLRDVTRYFSDTDADEFYWDLNGTGWRTSIEKLSANLVIDKELRQSLNGDTACYQGRYGSSDQCTVTEIEDGFSLSASNLDEGENVTIAVGFLPGTFEPYQQSQWEKLVALWLKVTIVTTFIAVAVIIWLLVRAHRLKYRSSEIGTIVPEYLPPKNASVATSDAVSPEYTATWAAQLTDLAVRHYIQIIETRIKKVFLPAEYEIKIIKDLSDLREEEKEILNDMFGFAPKVGQSMALKDLKNNSSAYARFMDNNKKLRELLRHRYGFKHIDKEKRAWFGGTGKVLLVLAVLTLSPPLLVAAIISFVFSKTLWVLSDEGLRLRRYLKGLEMYIKVAETERLKMLQSPEGAEKVAVGDPTNPAQLVKLYERVLPYAVLFGQEKEWSKQLGEYYATAGSNPDWYVGRTAFNAAAFSTAMSSFSGAVSATAASSSSSGGSGGGGFSGGGGGGGGGGFR